MVRRWSYINSLNSVSDFKFKSAQQGAFDATIHSTMYLKKVYQSSTVLTRRKWARRKHYYIWTPHLNLLKDWARTYRFHRNHFRIVFNQFFTKNSFIAFNLMSVKNLIPSSSRNSGCVVGGSLSKKVISYYFSRLNTRFYPLKSVKYANMFLGSWDPSLTKLEDISEGNYLVPLLIDQASTLSQIHTPKSIESQIVLTNLFNIIFSNFTKNLNFVYKTLVLLNFWRALKTL